MSQGQSCYVQAILKRIAAFWPPRLVGWSGPWAPFSLAISVLLVWFDPVGLLVSSCLSCLKLNGGDPGAATFRWIKSKRPFQFHPFIPSSFICLLQICSNPNLPVSLIPPLSAPSLHRHPPYGSSQRCVALLKRNLMADAVPRVGPRPSTQRGFPGRQHTQRGSRAVRGSRLVRKSEVSLNREKPLTQRGFRWWSGVNESSV